MSEFTKIILPESQIPKQWYNIAADLPVPPSPYLSAATHQPLKPDDLSAIFPMALIEQEVSTQRWIDIPEPVREMYQLWRPSPMYRARRLEKVLGTPAHIYYKWEGVSPSGSHKSNTAIPQAYYNKMAGIKRLSTETGAGQWGTALATACSFFGLACTVYMVKVSYEQKPYRRSLMQVYGAEVFASPTNLTNAGRSILEKYPNSSGSLGVAISEAVEDAATHDDTNYSLGSVLNHVLLHQSIIGLESKAQLELVNDYPDIVIGCVGGGSNFGGLAFPFLADKFAGKELRAIAVEPSACPTLTKGTYAYDYGDVAQLTPMMRMYTLGHGFMPASIHAGGLRYHGASALVSQLAHEKQIESVSYAQNPVFEAALMFARAEAILPAPESSHAIRAAIDEALKAKEEGKERTILFGLSGHGHFDLSAYDAYLSGKLVDLEHSQSDLEKALAELPTI